MTDILEKVGHHPCYIMGDYNLDVMKHGNQTPTEKILI